MRDDARARRRVEIADAAYEILEEKGYAGTSMLAIAKRARASNETLYKWYGDKRGLFRTLVADHAEAARQIIDECLSDQGSGTTDLYGFLVRFGAVLLFSKLSERAVALNRAAAADATGELIEAMRTTGRETIRPLLRRVFARHQPTGAFTDTDDMVDTYIALLISNRQHMRMVGILPAPSEPECRAIAEDATAKFRHLMRD